MATSRSSVSVEATPEVAFAFVSDPANLAACLPGIVSAVPAGGDAVRVTVDSGGASKVGEAWFHVKEGRHGRVEWGTDSPSHYHGWLEIDREGEVASITAEVHTEGMDAESLDGAVDRALFALKDRIEQLGV